MFPILAVVCQNSAPPAPAWNKVLEMKFNGSFSDSTGRHSPVSYGAVISTSQSVEGGSSMYANQNGRVHSDDMDGESTDFDFTDKDFRIECNIYPTSIGNDYVWMKSSGFNFGLCLRINNTYVAGRTTIFCTGVGASGTFGGGGAAVTVDNLVGKWSKILVEREGDTYRIALDDVDLFSFSGVNETTDPTGGAGYRGFQICGQSNNSRYSGYIDNFVVYTK